MRLMYKIKQQAEDFIVEEITDQETLSINKKYEFKQSEGKFLICTLKKKNWDTQLALRKIAKRLRISKNRIGFAGTKDKKAVTIQLISITNIEIEEVNNLKIKDIEVTPLYYSNERISLGNLKGNHFKIKVYTNQKPKHITKIPNYFGKQRFGKTRPITHLVGEKIIRGSTKDAVLIYLTKTFEKESEEAKEAREKLSEKMDFKEALDYFPNYLKFERILLNHLAQYPEDFIGALRVLPKTLKMMFVHAYQSYLFNKMLDYLIKNKLEVDELPLIGYDSDLTDWQLKILKEENIKLEDFRIKEVPELSSPGFTRKSFIEIKDLKTKQEEDSVILEFSLTKGAYATTVIDFLFQQT